MLLFFLSLLETQEEQDKFTLIYERYYKLLINISFNILHNGQDAEDAVQQAFMKLIPNLGKIEDISSRKTINYLVIWLRGFATIFAKSRRKSSKYHMMI